MNGDSFAIMLACGAFVLGVGLGLYIGDRARPRPPLPRGKPVSDRRMRRLWVIDPLLDRGPSLERSHPTTYRVTPDLSQVARARIEAIQEGGEP